MGVYQPLRLLPGEVVANIVKADNGQSRESHGENTCSLQHANVTIWRSHEIWRSYEINDGAFWARQGQ